METRVDRTQYFLAIAELASKRATCTRLHVGAVLVDHNHHIIATGYNGSPPGAPHCSDVDCLIEHNHCIRSTHAEESAILNMVVRPPSYTCFVTHQPCIRCYRMLVASGCIKVYYGSPYENQSPAYIQLQKELKVEMEHVPATTTN